MSNHKPGNTLVFKIQKELDQLEVNQTIVKSEIVSRYWDYADFYTIRAFDVHLCKARVIEGKEFKVKDGVISRIK